MAEPLKIKIRKWFNEAICMHKNVEEKYISGSIYNDFYSYVDCKCKDCGKTWTK